MKITYIYAEKIEKLPIEILVFGFFKTEHLHKLFLLILVAYYLELNIIKCDIYNIYILNKHTSHRTFNMFKWYCCIISMYVIIRKMSEMCFRVECNTN